MHKPPTAKKKLSPSERKRRLYNANWSLQNAYQREHYRKQQALALEKQVKDLFKEIRRTDREHMAALEDIARIKKSTAKLKEKIAWLTENK